MIYYILPIPNGLNKIFFQSTMLEKFCVVCYDLKAIKSRKYVINKILNYETAFNLNNNYR